MICMFLGYTKGAFLSKGESYATIVCPFSETTSHPVPFFHCIGSICRSICDFPVFIKIFFTVYFGVSVYAHAIAGGKLPEKEVSLPRLACLWQQSCRFFQHSSGRSISGVLAIVEADTPFFDEFSRIPSADDADVCQPDGKVLPMYGFSFLHDRGDIGEISDNAG